MAAQIDPYLTDVGLAAAIDARKNGLALSITHVALGSGRYNSSTSGASKTAMVARKESVTIPAGTVSGTGGFSCDVIFPEWAGASYDATELGFFAGNPAAGGKLIFVWSSTTEVLVQRNLLQFAASFIFQLTRAPSDTITVQLDSQSSLAAALIGIHEGKDDPHPRYIRRDGDTATGWVNFLTPARGDRSQKAATTEFLDEKGPAYSSLGGVGYVNNYAIKADQANIWFDQQADNKTITLPPTSGVLLGTTITIRCSHNNGLVQAQGADNISIGDILNSGNSIRMNRGDVYVLTRNEPGIWYVLSRCQSQTVGQISYFPGLVPPSGHSELNGALLSRSVYPRLWAFAQSTGLVSEADWNNNGYWGRFSVGTSGENFRIPDMRSVFLRGLDNGRGAFDPGREWGRLQNSENLYHAHGVWDGGHSHTGYTSANGEHTHGVPDGDNHDGQGNNFDSGGRGMWRWVQTQEAGNHNHTVYTYASATNIGIYGAGGNEARPNNQAVICCIRNN